MTNFIRNSLKNTFFPGYFEGASALKNYEKLFSGNYFGNNFVSEVKVLLRHSDMTLFFRAIQRLACYDISWRQRKA